MDTVILSGRDLLFTLVLKVGWAASLAALLVRFASFRKLVFTENRNSDQKVMLLLFLAPPLAVGVMLRLFGYNFFDLTLEGSFLMGLMGGRMVGLLGGSLISLPAFFNHEWLASPMAALVGLLAGVVRRGDSGKRGRLALWAVSVSEYPAVAREAGSRTQGQLGDAAAVCLRGF